MRIALLADGNEASGLGHLSRCVALAEALVEQSAEPILVGDIADSYANLVSEAGLERATVDVRFGSDLRLSARLAAIERIRPDALVVDSYELDVDGAARLSSTAPTMCIDDFGRLPTYPCDAVLNFTVAAPSLRYITDARLYLGTRWFLARRAIREVRSNRPQGPAIGEVQRCLIAVGGVDRSGATEQLVRSMLRIGRTAALDVVVGAAYPEPARLRSLVEEGPPGSRLTVGAASLAHHLNRTDLVLSGGGLTKYEAAYLGIPAAVLSQTPDQAEETHTFALEGAAADLGIAGVTTDASLDEGLTSLFEDTESRLAMCRAGLALFPPDPTGAAASAVLQLVH